MSDVIDSVNEVKNFIDDGDMAKEIESIGSLVYPIIKFISMNTDGEVRVLIGGQCPACCARNLRNVCNIAYANDVMRKVIIPKFNFVINVMPVLTTDDDFVSVVNEAGYKCITLARNALRTKVEHRKQINDEHPEIDAAICMEQRRIDSLREYAEHDNLTRTEMTRNYSYIWNLDDCTSIVTKHGKLAKGKWEILTVGMRNELPEGMVIFGMMNDKVGLRFIQTKQMANKKFISLQKIN